ncbi:MAG: DinB family protein [Cytophagales bacterium]|nr:DinB family protein [Cytophagales bacterium]
MKEVTDVIQSLEQLIAEVPAKFKRLSIEEINHKPSPGKWSKKEILGHLCDSCFNNLHRIIRVQYEEQPFIVYDQEEWVKRQNYRERDFDDVLDLWISLHRQFIHALKSFPENHLNSLLDWGGEVTAQFVITDYLDHHNHHLRQIFGNRIPGIDEISKP